MRANKIGERGIAGALCLSALAIRQRRALRGFLAVELEESARDFAESEFTLQLAQCALYLRLALGIAWVWRERDSYAGPWVFYSSHARKRAMGEDPRAVYHPTALLRALRLAETRAGVTHRPYRGMHGFRRAVAGDVARSTGNLKLAMEYIGDTDIRRSREYIQVRPDHLKEAASVMDRARPNRTQTVPEAGAASEPAPELVAAGGTAELPRQDSNLRPAG